MKILVCEDDNMTMKVLIHTLKKDGYDIVSARDGVEAKKILDNNQIDFILTDLHMPNLNGLELIGYARNDLRTNIPIVMLTRVGVEDTVLKAFELGADDYITKPFNPSELSLRIKKAILKNNPS